MSQTIARNKKPESLTKGDLFRLLSEQVPLNQYHLPDHVYRADIVPLDLYDYMPVDRQNILEAATLYVTLDHGYPAVDETLPFWDRLPGETQDAFDSFIGFLEMPAATKGENPVRLLPLIAEATGHSITSVVEWCHVYYWHWRARAYDLFIKAAHQKQREQRILTIEGSHFAMAETMMRTVTTLTGLKLERELRMLTQDPDAETETKAKDLVDMAVKLAGLQRVSVGLPANGPDKLEVTGARAATVSETFKAIAKEGTPEQATTQRSQEMDTLLADPRELMKAQELLIRMTNPNVKLPTWGDKVLDGEIIPNDSVGGTNVGRPGEGGRQRTNSEIDAENDTIAQQAQQFQGNY